MNTTTAKRVPVSGTGAPVDLRRRDRCRLSPPVLAVVLLVAGLARQGLAAQADYGALLGRQEAGRATYYPTGATVLTETITPSLMKWYLPQALSVEHRWQWDYTNYARERYHRYIEPSKEGDNFYDLYGRFLNRGWLVYDWRQTQPISSQGSSITKMPSQYNGWLNSLVIASDKKGQHNFSLTIGDEIRTTLTPMTFNKTAFNGIQLDYSSDRYSGTAVMSRLNNPVVLTDGNPVFFDNYTNLLGLRGVWSISDYVSVGGTLVNAANGRSSAGRFGGGSFKGRLTTGQMEGRIDRLILRISDDSPEDGRGGAILYASDIEIETMINGQDTVLVGSRVGFQPRVTGGTTRYGFLIAEGTGEASQILLEYVFSSTDRAAGNLESILPEPDLVNNIKGVRFRLLLSNDYKVEVTSDRQTDNAPAAQQPQFLTVVRAPGNVTDSSNQQWVEFDYGLPTALQVVGFTLEAKDVLGFELYGEANVNHQYRQYPNLNLENHRAFSGARGNRAALGWMVNVSRDFYPFSFFGEAFGMDPEYSTSTYIVDGSGRTNYASTADARSKFLFDFVDDNDDHDRKNDQKRLYDDSRTGEERGINPRSLQGFADEAVFPGLDENNDFISDFNQNNSTVRPNLLPDYEEPFWRYHVDRPEFLFSLDLNNNGWGDRFENDDEPDYPYRRDRLGYNAYLNTRILPELKLMVGQERLRRLSADERNLTTYALVAYERSYPLLGAVSFYNMAKLAEDDIADDVVQWVQPRPKLGRTSGTGGFMQYIGDPLAMRNTLIDEMWLRFRRDSDAGLNSDSKLVFGFLRQRGDGQDTDGQDNPKSSRRVGLINKVDYFYRLGSLTLQPRFKHELFIDNTPFNAERALGDPTAERQDWTGMLSLVARYPFLRRTTVEGGLEWYVFRDFTQHEVSALDRPAGLNEGDPTGDYNQVSVALQFTNTTAYAGYNLLTQLGLRLDRRRTETYGRQDATETSGISFVTVYASMSD